MLQSATPITSSPLPLQQHCSMVWEKTSICLQYTATRFAVYLLKLLKIFLFRHKMPKLFFSLQSPPIV